jgi:aminoglycoside/choline kinase family phosphotransferase
MDAPPPQEDVRPFVQVDGLLRGRGYSAPEILAADTEAGLLLLEDLGDDLFTACLDAGGDEGSLYGLAVDFLVDVFHWGEARDLPRYSDEVFADEAELFLDWYLPLATGRPADPAAALEYRAAWRKLANRMRCGPDVLVLRDFHAANLIHLPDRHGLARLGLLDFQDARAGPPAYDLVSLLEDARRDVPPELASAMVDRYLAGTGLAREPFLTSYAVLGAQRNVRILGVFARLWRRDGKSRYLSLLPRVWGLVERDLAHPALGGMKALIDDLVEPAIRSKAITEESGA